LAGLVLLGDPVLPAAEPRLRAALVEVLDEGTQDRWRGVGAHGHRAYANLPRVYACSCLEKNSSALRVFVVWLPPTSMPRSDRNARVSAATWNASAGAHFVDSSRMRVPSGYSHSSTTILRARSPGVPLILTTKMGPSSDRSSSAMPSGACSA